MSLPLLLLRFILETRLINQGADKKCMDTVSRNVDVMIIDHGFCLCEGKRSLSPPPPFFLCIILELLPFRLLQSSSITACLNIGRKKRRQLQKLHFHKSVRRYCTTLNYTSAKMMLHNVLEGIKMHIYRPLHAAVYDNLLFC